MLGPGDTGRADGAMNVDDGSAHGGATLPHWNSLRSLRGSHDEQSKQSVSLSVGEPSDLTVNCSTAEVSGGALEEGNWAKRRKGKRVKKGAMDR